MPLTQEEHDRLRALQTEFANKGGRGVEIAEEIDDLMGRNTAIHYVLLQIETPIDGTPPVVWDWPELCDMPDREHVKVVKPASDSLPFGGYWGVVLSFGPGTDRDTVRTVFDRMVDGKYVVDLTLHGGETFTAVLQDLDYDPEDCDVFVVRRMDEEGNVSDEDERIPFEWIIGMEVC